MKVQNVNHWTARDIHKGPYKKGRGVRVNSRTCGDGKECWNDSL